MDIRISKESDIPLRQQIAAQIEYQIAVGKLKPGDPLPSVRALACQLRASREISRDHLSGPVTQPFSERICVEVSRPSPSRRQR